MTNAQAQDVAGFESDALRDRAAELDAEASEHDATAAQHVALATATRTQAATLRARADRLDDPSKGVKPAPSAIRRVRGDGLMAAAGVAVESLSSGFSARDLAAAVGIADVARATRLLAALEEFGKVSRYGDGWMANDPDETRVRDFAVESESFTLGDVIVALALSELDASFYVNRLRDKGMIEGTAGHYTVVPVPPNSDPRPRRTPPEKTPPAYTEAPKRGEAVRIVDHGKRATATSRHREKLRDQRHAAMQEAREQAAERARAKEKKTGMRSKKNRRK